jgi:RNA polymerase-binding transcription factor DksA
MDTELAAEMNQVRPWGDGAVGAAGEDAGDSPEATIGAVDRILDAVEAALTRLDDGTYRLCSRCGATMEDARLAADPTATICVRCAAVPDGSTTETGDEDPPDPGDAGPARTGYAAPSSTA